MNCLETRKYLSAFLDNELDVRTNVEVIEHLEMCPRCAGRLEAESRLKETVSGYVASVRAPLALAARISDAVMTPVPRSRRVGEIYRDFTRRGGVMVFAAAASILVVFTLIYHVLLAPPAVVNSGAIAQHVAVLRDQVINFVFTRDAERARNMALFRMRHRPDVPMGAAGGEFELVGAGPSEIELKNVGHFVFLYHAETVSMFVFEGLDAGEVAGKTIQTRLGAAKVDSRRGMNLVSWYADGFTYILVSRLPQEDLLSEVGPSLLGR